jgi:N-acetylneuraminate synthase
VVKTFIIGEIGINHNGKVETGIELMELAKKSGFDAVKFQKRNPELYPERVYNSPLFGETTYREHKRRLELSYDDYVAIDTISQDIGIEWFASCFDKESVDFIAQFKLRYWKIPSPVITDLELIEYFAKQSGHLIMSTGMSSMPELSNAIRMIPTSNFSLLHCCSEYPCPIEHVNLEMIRTLKESYPDNSIGYSSHDGTVVIPVSAVCYGAEIIEVHITKNRSQKGSDHSASLEIVGMETLVRHIRAVELASGSGIKQFYPEEQKIRDKVKQVKRSS